MNRAILLRVSPAARLASALLTALFLTSLPVSAQEYSLSGVVLDANVTVEQLEAVIQDVDKQETLDADTRRKVIDRLRDAQVQVQQRIAVATAAANFVTSMQTAPAETKALRRGVDAPMPAAPTPESLAIDDSTTLPELEQRLAMELAKVTVAKSELTDLEADIGMQEGRPAAARQRINELRVSRDSLATALDVPPATTEPQVVTDMRRFAVSLRRDAQRAEIAMLEQELLSHGVRLDLLKVQRDSKERSRFETERLLELLRSVVNNRRQAAALLAQQAAAAAELAASDKPPVVQQLAANNASLTRELASLTADVESETHLVEEIRSQTTIIEGRLARSQQHLQVAGLSRVLGRLLVEERRNLPRVAQYHAQVRARSRTMAEVGLARLRVQEQRRELTPLDAAAQKLMTELSAMVTDEQELADIQIEIRRMLSDRRDLLLKADESYGNYLQLLGDLDVAQRRLLDSADLYKVFLDENLLWTPSAPLAFTGGRPEAVSALEKALAFEPWLATIATLYDSLSANFLSAVAFLAVLTSLLLARRPLAQRYKTMSALVGRPSTDRISLTLAALAIAATRALPLPLLFAAVSWFLREATPPTTHSLEVAGGFKALAPYVFNLLFLRVLCAKDGVLRVHFGWQQDGLATIRRQLDRLLTIAAPLVFASVVFYASEFASVRATVGRLAFIALMVVLAITLRPLAQPESSVATPYYRRWPDSWVSKLRWVWYALAVGAPLLLGVLSSLGYLYTSLILTGMLVETIWLALGLGIVNLVVLRWLALTRRRLAQKIALDEREKDSKPVIEGDAPVISSKPLDLDTVDQQTQKLLRVCLMFIAAVAGWGIWAKVLPAFTRLDHVALWSRTITLAGAEVIAPVTLADLFLAVLILAVTAIASKNLPGLMEITILQRLTLQPGSRYAINTLVRYAVVMIGVFSILNIIGWDWSQIQWLVAALSVGLGFGLQEIVANFVSGLVILFERPIRVGDTVTVGALTGTVSRVRIRATTVTDWDRKEIIVPNKSFITEPVVNWTLSDPITRVVVPVGISYNSDVELAHQVMLDTLMSLPLVLDEPPPKVYFVGFGESSLDFRLNVFSRQLVDRLPLTHAVHEAVLKSLRQNGIEIPFPQRDLHIKGAPGDSDVS